jgi:hypothetical protein
MKGPRYMLPVRSEVPLLLCHQFDYLYGADICASSCMSGVSARTLQTHCPFQCVPILATSLCPFDMALAQSS